MGNDRIAKRVYVGESVDSCLVGQLQKRWIESKNNFVKKGLHVEHKGKIFLSFLLYSDE